MANPVVTLQPTYLAKVVRF